jgi:hypothetical protein
MRQSIDNELSAEPVEQSVSACQRRLDNLIELKTIHPAEETG